MNSSTILLISYELALVWRSKFALNNSDWSILTFGSISVSGYDANWSEMHVKKVKALCTITFIFRFKKVPPPSLPNSNSKTNHKNIFRALMKQKQIEAFWVLTLLGCQSEWPKDKPFILMHSRHARNLYHSKKKEFLKSRGHFLR